jgi:molybdate transport system substrate-binding protein
MGPALPPQTPRLTLQPLQPHAARLWRAAVVCTVALASVAAAAGEIRVMTSGAFAAALGALAPGFEQASGDRVVTVTTSTGVGREAIPNRMARGDAVDVVILPEAALDELIARGLVERGSKVALARSAIGMAVRAGAPKPDIGTVAALRAVLLQAKSVAYSASVSGEYLATELFPRLGIADQMKAKSLRIERERVGAVVARGEAEIGFQQISELLEVKGVDFVAPLPPDVQRVTVIAAGIAARARNPDGARRMLQMFASPESASSIKAVGMEPLASR